MKSKKIRTADLVVIAFLITIEIVLTRFFSINMQIVRIGFGFLPIALAGIIFGPLWAGACYAIGDVLGVMIFPTGPYFPGFTLTAFLTGLVYGLILHGKPVTWRRTFFSALVVCCILNLCLDTIWLFILYGHGVTVMLPSRLIKVCIMVPVQTLLIRFVWGRCSPMLGRGRI